MALDPANFQLATILWIDLIVLREPERALETLATIEAHSPTLLPTDQARAITLFAFTGNADVFAPYSGIDFFRQQAGVQDPSNALRDNLDRLIVREHYGEARDLIDSVPFDTTRNVFVEAFLVTGTGDTPNADYRGFLSLLLGDVAAAEQDGRRVVDFLARTPETPENRWYRLALRADASVFQGDRAQPSRACARCSL